MLSCHIKPNFIILKIFSHLLRCRSDNSVNKSQTKHSDYQLNLTAIWLTCWTGSNYKTCFNSNAVSIHISVHLRTSETWYKKTETNSFVWSAGLRDYLQGKKLCNTLFIGSSMDHCNYFLHTAVHIHTYFSLSCNEKYCSQEEDKSFQEKLLLQV